MAQVIRYHARSVSKSSDQTFSGTQFVCHKTCVTTVDCCLVSRPRRRYDLMKQFRLKLRTVSDDGTGSVCCADTGCVLATANKHGAKKEARRACSGLLPAWRSRGISKWVEFPLRLIPNIGKAGGRASHKSWGDSNGT